MTIPIDPETQRQRFWQGVNLLGGIRPAARILDCNERTLRALCDGSRTLHDGWLRDLAAALIAHADKCRAHERRISPAFAANLTEEQRNGKRDPRRFDMKGENPNG
jgi:hypothetical protein